MRRSTPHGRVSFSILGAIVLAGLGLGAPTVAQITITKLQPDKIRYVAGEEATFAISVKNAGAQPWSGKLVGTVESGLAQVTPLASHNLQLAPGEVKSFADQLRIDLPEFGSAVRVIAQAADGTVAAEARDVFCVGPWYYNMGRYMTAFELGRFKTPEQVQASLGPKWRSWYVTCIEHYSGAPGQWNGLNPTQDQWFAGQNGYFESVAGEESLVGAAHSYGMGVMIYEINGTCGPFGEEYSRAHPDWILYNDRGRPQGYFNVGELETWRTETVDNYLHGCPLWLSPDITRADVQQADLEDIIAFSRRFHFDGIRWDGHTILPGWSVFGEKLSDRLDERNAAWTRNMRSTLQKNLPGYTINYNYGPQSQEEGAVLPETYKAMGPNSYLLWESIRGSFKDPNSPLNRWEGYLEGVRAEVNQFARPTANFQHLGWYGTDSPIHQNHTQAIVYALGAHWDTWVGLKYDAFSMRFGAYLWDTQFRNLPDASPRIAVTDPEQHLWWKQFAQERDLGAGRRLLVTHLINRPVEERQTGFEKTAPAIQRDVKVTLTLQPGEKLARAFLLNPDADRNGWLTPAPVSVEGEKAVVTVPSVEYWSFVVWELQR
ncbi:MAG TPA: hypothetical protein VGM19_03160 [Armatimonadota bacterium]|jgi:hypothetical protein